MNQHAEWKQRFERVWDPKGQGKYRMGSPGQRLVPRFIEWVPKGSVVNEYGSGTGRAVVELCNARPDVRVNMVDIAENALEAPAKALVGGRATFTLSALWGLPEKFPVADWGYCIDVLMCVPPDRLDDILREIRRTCRNLFAQVYDWADIRLDIDYTTIKEGPEWWYSKFSWYWPTVSKVKSNEHARRYIYLCRGEEQ